MTTFAQLQIEPVAKTYTYATFQFVRSPVRSREVALLRSLRQLALVFL